MKYRLILGWAGAAVMLIGGFYFGNKYGEAQCDMRWRKAQDEQSMRLRREYEYINEAMPDNVDVRLYDWMLKHSR